MPALPVCLREPLWEQVAALVPARPAGAPAPPLGCHRRRVPDRVVFDRVVAALVHGSGDERIASPGCSDRTIRRRLREGAAAGLSARLPTLALRADDRMTGLELADGAVDGCAPTAPRGGEAAGRSPVDRGNQGRTRSVAAAGAGVPLPPVSAGANRHDAPLLGPPSAGLDKLDRLPADVTVHRDRGYDGAPSRALPEEVGCAGAIARTGVPAPVQAGARRVAERTRSRMHGDGKLRRGTETAQAVVAFSLFLAAALGVVRQLIQRARLRYRWPSRPTTRRLK